MDEQRGTVTVFGSGSTPEGSPAYREAQRLGAALAAYGLAVCNGGYGGTMEAVARGAQLGGALTIGCTLQGSGFPGPNRFIATVIPCRSLFDRIRTLLELGDGYAVLPGGTGTLAELGLMLETMNKRLMPIKPTVFIGPFWQPLLALMGTEGILRGSPVHTTVQGVILRGQVACAESPEAAAAFLAANISPRP